MWLTFEKKQQQPVSQLLPAGAVPGVKNQDLRTAVSLALRGIEGRLWGANSHKVRSLFVGNGLDARLRGRQLRPGRRALPQNRPPKRI